MLEKRKKFSHIKYQSYINNSIAFIGFVTASIWRLWGFTSLICALALLVLGAKPKQYFAILIIDIVFAVSLYIDFGRSSFSQAITRVWFFQVIGLFVWFLTLEYREPKTK